MWLEGPDRGPAVTEATAAGITEMAVAFAVVAAVAVPVLVVTTLLSRRSSLGGWQRWRNHWTGWELLALGFAYVAVPQAVLEVVPGIWSLPGQSDGIPPRENIYVITTSVFVRLIVVFAALAYKFDPRRVRPSEAAYIGSQVRVGVVVWLVLAPLTFTVHFATAALSDRLGGTDPHPLSRLRPDQSIWITLLFFASVCVVTPIGEELIFRRTLTSWAVRTSHSWCLVATAVVAAVLFGNGRVGPAAFVAVVAGLTLMLPKVRQWQRRFPVRSARAAVTSGVLFAAMHSFAWPTPVPLFVLGVGLGWLTLRTRSVVGPVVCHGLLNAVSTVYLLRHPPG
jgi:membrane protease YdiL (CAAX protease family)